MTSLVRLSMPAALLFFISVRVFLTSDVMIGGTSDESGLVLFREGCWPWIVHLYSSVQKRAQTFSISFLSICTSFSSFFSSGANNSNGKQNKTRSSIRINVGWSVFGKYREIFLDRHLPISLKRKVYNQCVLPAMTYGCQTWSLTKTLVKTLEPSRRAMERKMLNVKLKDRIRNTIIRQRTRVTDTVQYVTNTKWKWAGHIARGKDNSWTVRTKWAGHISRMKDNSWTIRTKWAGHIARMKDNRWTIRSTEWQINGVNSVARPKRRWRDDNIVGQQGAVWTRTAKDRERWRTLVEGYFLQLKDAA